MNLLDQVENLRGAAALWDEWAREWGREVDTEGFLGECIDAMRRGNTCFVVAYNAMGRAVGMVTVFKDYDTSTSHYRAVGQRLYVAPEYRGAGVFKAIWNAAFFLSTLMGVQEEVISCSMRSSFLLEAYEAAGFEITDVILKRDVL